LSQSDYPSSALAPIIQLWLKREILTPPKERLDSARDVETASAALEEIEYLHVFPRRRGVGRQSLGMVYFSYLLLLYLVTAEGLLQLCLPRRAVPRAIQPRLGEGETRLGAVLRRLRLHHVGVGTVCKPLPYRLNAGRERSCEATP